MAKQVLPKVPYPIKKSAVLKGGAREVVRTDLVARYEKGASIRGLAELTGRSYGFVHRLLNEDQGVIIRKRGGDMTAARRRARES